MDPAGTRTVLALLALPGIGRVTARRFLDWKEEPGVSPARLFSELNDARRSGIRLPHVASRDVETAFERADEVLSACAEQAIEVWTPRRDPAATTSCVGRLFGIADAPVAVYSMGDTSALGRSSVTVVGTRKPTERGADTALRIGKKCAEEGFSVVSGLAVGCDAQAHRGALEANGKTVAIMAHGLDQVHPFHHSRLAAEIRQSGGCLLSEYPPGVRPQRRYFVERDRLQSAAGVGVIVIETGVGGGTMHTVRFAREQGRRVACLVPQGEAVDTSVQGNVQLLREGAFPIADPADVARFLGEAQDDDREAERGSAQTPGPPRQPSLFVADGDPEVD